MHSPCPGTLGALLAAAIFLRTSNEGAAQERIRDAACETCCVHFDFQFSVGGEQHPLPWLMRSIVVVDDNRFLATFNGDDQSPFFITADGAVREIGTVGAGPGEYRRHLVVTKATDTDTLYVVDPHNARTSVLAPDGSFVRSFRTLAYPATDAVVIGDSVIILSAHVQSPELAGDMLHAYRLTGERIASFGRRTDRIDDLSRGQLRHVAAGHGDRFWVVVPGQYRIEEWSVGGQLIRSLQRSVAWFEPHGENMGLTQDGTPLSIVSGVDVFGDTMLVSILVPDARWQEHSSRQLLGNRMVGMPTDLERTFDTVLELIDLRRGAVIASRRVDDIVPFVTGRYVATAAMEQDEEPTVRVWSVRRDTNCEE